MADSPLTETDLNAALMNTAHRARLLLDGTAGPLNERQRKLVKDILADIDQVRARVSSALPSSPAAARSEVFKIRPIIEELFGQFRFKAKGRQIEFRFLAAGINDRCRCDPIAVRKLLFDALTNALQHAASGGMCTIELRSSGNDLQVALSAPDWVSVLPPALATSTNIKLSAGKEFVITIPAVT